MVTINIRVNSESPDALKNLLEQIKSADMADVTINVTTIDANDDSDTDGRQGRRMSVPVKRSDAVVEFIKDAMSKGAKAVPKQDIVDFLVSTCEIAGSTAASYISTMSGDGKIVRTSTGYIVLV